MIGPKNGAANAATIVALRLLDTTLVTQKCPDYSLV
jgi:hypothetical protein